MTVIEILNQYGFATLAAVAMGYFIYFIYTFVTEEIIKKLSNAMATLIALIDRVRVLDNDIIRLRSKLNTVLELREQEQRLIYINSSMKTLNLISVFFGLLLYTSSLQSSELTQDFKNPSFSGNGYSNHVLSIDQLETQRKQKIKEDKEAKARQAERDEENKTINRFIANVESRIYANISKQLVDNMFSDTGQTSGTAEIEGATIVWNKDSDLGTIAITITEADGTITTLTVPIGDFGF